MDTPGYIVNICREITENLYCETGLESLSFEDGRIDLSSIAEEIQESSLEEMFTKKVQEVETILSLKRGIEANISFERKSGNTFSGFVNASEKNKDLLSQYFPSTMGLSKEEASKVFGKNNSLCFTHNFLPGQEMIDEYVKNTISDTLSKVRSTFERMIEEGVIANFSVSNHMVSFSFPPNENISDVCENTLLEEITNFLKQKFELAPSDYLTQKYLDEGRFVGVEVEDSLVGLLFSKSRSSLQITGVLVESEIVSEYNSVEVPPNTIKNDSVIDCDFISSNIKHLLKGLRL